MEQHQSTNKNLYDKSYKWLLIIPLILFLFALFHTYQFYQANDSFFKKDVSLTGGTAITVFDSSLNSAELRQKLSISLPDVQTNTISDIRTGNQVGIIIETTTEAEEAKNAVESATGYSLTTDNSSIEFSGSTLSQGFFRQLMNSLAAAFLLMALVVFIIFSESKNLKSIAIMISMLGFYILLPAVALIKGLALLLIIGAFIYGLFGGDKKAKDYLILLGTFVLTLIIFYLYPKMIILGIISIVLLGMYAFYSVPSIAIILAAFADIVMTVAVVNIMGVSVSSAGIVAFLMIIGYSVDTDILLTTRLLKSREGSVNSRIYDAFKTGTLMTLTAIVAVGISLVIIYNFSETLRQIFGILLIGLVFDLVNTWIANAGILKWYVEAKKIA